MAVSCRSKVAILVAAAACVTAHADVATEMRDAVAPTGKLRVAFLVTTPTHATRDPISGELKGPAVELGKEMARRLGVAFEPVTHASFPPVLAGAAAGEWDVAMMGISADRAKVVDFTAPYMVVEFGYLVPDRFATVKVSELEAPAMRVAVLEKSSPEAYLARTTFHATLVRFPTIADMVQAMRDGRADVAFGTKAGMLSQSEKLPGSIVLDGPGGEETALAVPKGREQAAAYARQFVTAVKLEGLVKGAIQRAALRGVIVAPAQ